MADGSETVLLDQISQHALEQSRQPVQHGHQGAQGHSQLFRHGAQGDAVSIVQQHHAREELIAQQMFGQYGWGLSLQAAAATGTVLFLQPVNDPLGLQRRTVEHRAETHAFIGQWAATVGTVGGRRDGFDPVGLERRDRLAAVAGMSGFQSPGIRAVRGGRVGLESNFHSRGGEPKKPCSAWRWR